MFSSMCLLHKLHNPDKKGFEAAEEFSCNECQASITTRYKCKTCSDYDVCIKCYEEQLAGRKAKHEHVLEKIVPNSGLLGMGEGQNDKSGQANKNPRASIDRCLSGLSHAVRCRDANCSKNSCSK